MNTQTHDNFEPLDFKQIETVLRALGSTLRKDGSEYRGACISHSPDKNPSMKVYYDHKDSRWSAMCESHGCSVMKQIREKAWQMGLIGSAVQFPDKPKSPTHTPPEPEKKKEFIAAEQTDKLKRKQDALCDDGVFYKDNPGARYLTDERGISPEIVVKLGFGYHGTKDGWPGESIILPAIWDGELIGIKYRPLKPTAGKYPQEDGSKTDFLAYADLEPVNPESKTVCVFEGQFDAALAMSLGFNAVAVISKSLPRTSERFLDGVELVEEKYHRVLLIGDMDPQGEEAMDELFDIFGAPGTNDGVLRSWLPYKDRATKARYKDFTELWQKEPERAEQWLKAVVGSSDVAGSVFPWAIPNKEYKGPRRKGRYDEGVLRTKKSTFDYWFPKGRTHCIAGATGAGKSTFMLDMLARQERGEYVLGHAGAGFTYRVLMADRGEADNQETLRRLGLSLEDEHYHCLEDVGKGPDSVAAIKDYIEGLPEIPDVVFVEGADFLVKKTSDPDYVEPFLRAFNRLAKHYHISIILSLGTGKSRKGEEYAIQRQKILGTQAWGRLLTSVVVLDYVAGEDDAERTLFHSNHNSAAELFEMKFNSEGQLVEKSPVEVKLHPLEAWLTQRDPDKFWTTKQISEGMDVAGSPMTIRGVSKRVEKLFHDDKADRRTLPGSAGAFAYRLARGQLSATDPDATPEDTGPGL